MKTQLNQQTETPFDNFSQLQLPDSIANALERMQFVTPTPIQSLAIHPALDGKDILATAQTGTGKTGAFGIPLMTALARDHVRQALVLAPTRELAAQIFTVLKQLNVNLRLKGALVIGGESFRRQQDEIARGLDFIVATPGRLNDHLEAGTVDLRDVELVVLDEVDRMLDMGFVPQIRAVLRHVPAERQTLLFSATLPDEIKQLAAAFQKEPIRISVGHTTQPTVQVQEETIKTSPEGKNPAILKAMREREGKILVFARTKSRTDRLARLLHKEGHAVVSLHGGRSQSQRKAALERFRNGAANVMVATDLAGRGIDVPDIQHVINYDVPATREDYIHRIGRAGRGGKTGHALNLLVNGDAESEAVVTGKKPAPRVVFRGSSRGRRRSRR